jgi:hypothetical protein
LVRRVAQYPFPEWDDETCFFGDADEFVGADQPACWESDVVDT